MLQQVQTYYKENQIKTSPWVRLSRIKLGFLSCVSPSYSREICVSDAVSSSKTNGYLCEEKKIGKRHEKQPI